jgi:hypothetical protein
MNQNRRYLMCATIKNVSVSGDVSAVSRSDHLQGQIYALFAFCSSQ